MTTDEDRGVREEQRQELRTKEEDGLETIKLGQGRPGTDTRKQNRVRRRTGIETGYVTENEDRNGCGGLEQIVAQRRREK